MATDAINTRSAVRPIGRVLEKSPLFLLFCDIAEKLAASWAWYQNYRTSVRELNGLSNRELEDIGINRWDIPTVAMQSANAERQHRHAE